jgi:5-methylthioadenosine/S-adenosylhomocysteine deaminase
MPADPALLLARPGHGPATIIQAPTDEQAAIGGPGTLILPAPINAHDHGYGIRTLDFGAPDDALEPWVMGMRLRPRTDPYLEALVGFARLASAGVSGTMHCHNSHNADRLVDEAEQVCKAAGDVGIRLALSCPLLDFDPWAYGGGPARLQPYLTPAQWDHLVPLAPRYRPIAEQLAAVQAVSERCAGPMVDVQLGPIGPQWCSNALLEAIAASSADNNRRIHMHLLESPRQRAWLDQRFPQGIVRYLDEIGFLSPRLAVAHGVQLTQAELELLAERGVQLVSNPSANLRLRSGIAPISAAIAAGVKVALGLDGTGLDDDQDLWRELRLFHLLHGGCGLAPELSQAALFDTVTSVGAQVIGAPVGQDFVAIDYAALMADAVFEDTDAVTAILTRMTAHQVRGLSVAGRIVVADGQLQTVDFAAARAELLAQARQDRPRLLIERDNVAVLSDAVRRYYAEGNTGPTG